VSSQHNSNSNIKKKETAHLLVPATSSQSHNKQHKHGIAQAAIPANTAQRQQWLSQQQCSGHVETVRQAQRSETTEPKHAQRNRT
jgi:uncharacterized protein YifN (PemK superfamily)